MNVKDVLKHELIGLKAKVIDSSNEFNIGIEGEIIDETKETLTILQKKDKKRLMKRNVSLEIKFNNRIIQIQGKLLVKRPEDRIKK